MYLCIMYFQKCGLRQQYKYPFSCDVTADFRTFQHAVKKWKQHIMTYPNLLLPK